VYSAGGEGERKLEAQGSEGGERRKEERWKITRKNC